MWADVNLSADEFVALCVSDDPADFQRALREEAPEEVWLDVADRFPEHRWAVAHNKTNVGEKALTVLAEDLDPDIRARVCEKPECPVRLLMKLASDPDPSVRRSVANARHVPIELLVQLASDSDPIVRDAVVHAERTPAELLVVLTSDPVRKIALWAQWYLDPDQPEPAENLEDEWWDATAKPDPDGEWRELDRLERSLLQALLSRRFLGVEQLRRQMGGLLCQVVDQNGSIALSTGSGVVLAEVPGPVPIRGEYQDDDGDRVAVELWVRDGLMRLLQIRRPTSDDSVVKRGPWLGMALDTHQLTAHGVTFVVDVSAATLQNTTSLLDGFTTMVEDLPGGGVRFSGYVEDVEPGEVVDAVTRVLVASSGARAAVAENFDSRGVRFRVLSAAEGGVSVVYQAYVLEADPEEEAEVLAALALHDLDPRRDDRTGPVAAREAAVLFGIDPSAMIAVDQRHPHETWKAVPTMQWSFPWWEALGLRWPFGVEEGVTVTVGGPRATC